MLGIGLGLGPHARRPGGRALLPATAALAARMTGAPDHSRLLAIDGLISALTAAGLWPRIDALYVLAGHDAQASRLNWVQAAYDLTAVNSPAFTADRGWQGDGATSYLTSGFNPAIAGNRLSQNNSHLGIWSLTNLQNDGGANSSDIGSRAAGVSDYSINRFGASSPGGAVMGIGHNGAAYGAATPALYPGHVSWSRTAATAWDAFSDGLVVGSGTQTSTAPNAVEFRLLASNGRGFGVNQLAAAHWGAGLAPADMLVLRNALRAYLVTVGALAP